MRLFQGTCVIFVFVFLSLQASANNFVLPIEGVPYDDWTIVNYSDLDPSSDVLDWKGGNYTYDGHDAIDFTLPNFAAMDAGVSVYAAQSGTVVSVHDGEYDRWSRVNENPGDQSNYIVIYHGNGLTTEYFHLKKNSLTVTVGDSVFAGQKIAQVGSSGYSSDPHLHFVVYQNNDIVETYQSPSFWWQNPLPYSGDVSGVLDHGIEGHFPSTLEFVNRPVGTGAFYLEDGTNQRVVSWANLHVSLGDLLEYRFYQPDGSQFSYSFSDMPQIRFGWWTASITLPDNPQLGIWSVVAMLNGNEFFRDSFSVLNARVAFTSPISESQFEGASQTFQWEAKAGATAYRVWLGSTSGGDDLGRFATIGTSITISGLPTDGSTVFATLKWKDTHWHTEESVSYTSHVETPAFIAPIAESQFDGASQTFQWEAKAGATAYRVWLGSTSGGDDLGRFATIGTSKTISGLPTDGSTVFATLKWKDTHWYTEEPVSYTLAP